MLRAAIAATLSLLACGRTELYSAGGDTPDADSGAPVCSAGSVRLCGPGCPPVTGCAGAGCTAPTDYQGQPSSYGVCWADDPEADDRCDGCNIGDACLLRNGVLTCVTRSVCETLWNDGVRDVCWNTDKTPFDTRPTPAATGCPAATHLSQYHACGGDCPPCDANDRCDGVAPDHPFGLCNGEAVGGYALSYNCGPNCPVCAVFEGSNVNLDLAYTYGVCMAVEDGCDGFVSEGFPGGLGCYDNNRHKVD